MVLNPLEQLVLTLRELYEGYGYTRFPMRRFEEYQLYLENKSFLTSERVLSFTDVSGKLMALKPDVTLSIVKHAKPERQGVEKLYYHESVYRVSPTDHQFTEISQIGVESLGEIDSYGACEVVRLAIESLERIGLPYVLDMSHMGLAGGLMEDAGMTVPQREEAFALIRQKNSHELKSALTKWQIAPLYGERIAQLPDLCGEVETTLVRAAELAVGPEMKKAVSELSRVYGSLCTLGLEKHIRLDFSIANDLDYYNGLVFKGYVEGAPRAVLSGGQYDRLMRKLGKAGDGLGFALYLDELTRVIIKPGAYDADVLALYGAQDDPAKVLKGVEDLRRSGLRVLASPSQSPNARVKQTLRFSDDGFQEVSKNA
ncbi:MAG: ATP phosphoribosyltransferase regulatory subunit [Eubacteriales bacterium]|nr:ATP phosphoribosyltransferase regulatory subunit [Eubacteriales bacterium]